MQQLLGLALILMSIIGSMVLSGGLAMFFDIYAIVITFGVVFVGFIFCSNSQENAFTHIKRSISSEKLTSSEAKSSALFFTKLNQLSIFTAMITLLFSIAYVLSQYNQPKILGPVLAVTMLTTLYSGVMSVCIFIPAKCKVLSLATESKAITSPLAYVFIGAIVIAAAALAPWLLTSNMASIVDIYSAIFILTSLVGLLLISQNLNVQYKTQYLTSSLIVIGLIMFLVGLVSALSYDMENFEQFLKVFSVASLTFIYAVLIATPLYVLAQQALEAPKYTQDIAIYTKQYTVVVAIIVGLTAFVLQSVY